jgi:hypothetical protein
MSITKEKLVDAVLSDSCVKLCIAIALFLAWIGLTIAKAFMPVLDISLLVPWIQAALGGLGLYHALNRKKAADTNNDSSTGQAPPPPPIEKETS